MSDAFIGSIELHTSTNESIGVAGKQWTLEAVPVVLEALHGITGLDAVDPEQQPTGRTPEAQWSGQDDNGLPVTAMLWREDPYETTAIAKAIAKAIEEGDAS